MAARRGNSSLAGDAESREVDRLRAGETWPLIVHNKNPKNSRKIHLSVF